MKTKLLSGNKIAAFTPDVASETICYPVNTPEKVDFVAYHPYVTLVNTYEYSVNVVTQNSQTKIDLMVAENNNSGAGYNKTNTQPLNLKFHHQLARVVLNVKAGANVTIPNKDALSIVIAGMNTTAKFDISTLTLSAENTVAKIAPYFKEVNSDVYTYEAILLPIDDLTNNHLIEFKVNNKTYEWIINNATNINNVTSLEKGKVYTFNITIQETKVEVGGAIKGWEPIDSEAIGLAN